ncbi:MAG: hypothetical protein EA376_06415 [Phycisphaeraceae bacterium]|nr:MAG: hypothetical protein EA376_06415 [Phycisphaeraceae bacterium]
MENARPPLDIPGIDRRASSFRRPRRRGRSGFAIPYAVLRDAPAGPDPLESVCEHVFGRSMQMRRQIGLMRLGILAALAGAYVFGCAGAMAQQRNAIERPGAIHTSAEGQYEYFGGLRLDPDIPSPESVLGHRPGERFTRHHEIVEYLTALADASDRVTIERYGWTHQRRPMHILTITSPANHERLDEILSKNRELADPRNLSDPRAREIVRTNPSIVWFSYNVHGNEPSPAETAMQVAYTMAAGLNEEILDILDTVVLVIDPMLNPDGHSRYLAFYDNAMGAAGPIAAPIAAEHEEPWPGGRSNHYLFDLNRDWLWLVHPESRSRLPVYRRYMPHLHIDNHEQQYTAPYFFGAGDDPYNVNIPAETREWIDLYGEANAKVFDAEGLVYATRERFDYLYPGYGKVLPVYHGAVGLLTEKAGHSRAGLAIEVSDQYTLTLVERTRHHFLTSMNYLETTAAHREGQLERFRNYFAGSMEAEEDGPQAFVISAENDPALLQKVWELCSAHGIEIHELNRAASLPGLRDYRTGEAHDSIELPAGSWVIPAGQPMGRLARAIFERETEVTHEETYDITGWSLPIFFGLESWEATSPIRVRTARLREWSAPEARVIGEGDVALVIDAAQHHFPRAVGAAMRHELFCRVAGGDISIGGHDFRMGSLIVHLVRNPQRDIDAFIAECLEAGVNVHRVDTGMTTGGHVLGANHNRLYTLPRPLVLRGSPVSSLNYGETWHLLDIESPMPYTPVNADSFGRVRLDDFNVVVLPSAWGNIGSTLGSRNVDRLRDWVRSGGTVVAVGRSAPWANRALLELSGAESSDDDENTDAERPKLNELTWEERRLRRVEDNIPGAVLRAELDLTHPLSAGMREWVGVIRRGGAPMAVADSGAVVARFEDPPRIGGVISERNQARLANTPMMTHTRLGSGSVICISDEVTIRGFMHAPARLLLNAIIYGPTY